MSVKTDHLTKKIRNVSSFNEDYRFGYRRCLINMAPENVQLKQENKETKEEK